MGSRSRGGRGTPWKSQSTTSLLPTSRSWEVDLIVLVARGPVLIDPILKLLIVLVCLILVLMGGRPHHWWWGGAP